MRPSGLLDEEFAGDNWDLGALEADLLVAADAAVDMQALQGEETAVEGPQRNEIDEDEDGAVDKAGGTGSSMGRGIRTRRIGCGGGNGAWRSRRLVMNWRSAGTC